MEQVYIPNRENENIESIDKQKAQLEAFLKKNELTLVVARLDENARYDESKEENIYLARMDNEVNQDGDVLSRKIIDICSSPIECALQIKVK